MQPIRGFEVVALLAGLVIATGAHAQFKVEEIMAKGAQVMTAAQMQAELVGRTISGTTESGAQFEVKLEPNGDLEGMSFTPRGTTGMTGVWRITKKNQIYTDFTFTSTGAKVSRCNWYWKAGDEYFATNSRTDDDAAASFVDCLLSGGKTCDGGFSLSPRSVSK